MAFQIVENLKNNLYSSIATSNIYKLKEILMTSHENIWDSVDNDGNTCLILACNKGNYDIVLTILSIVKRKIENKVDNLNSWINQKADNGFNALHYASFRGYIKIVKLLIEYNASININTDNGLNCMHLASQGNCVLIVAYFHEYHKISYMCQDNGRATPLHWASYSGSMEVLDFLVNQKVNINLQDKDGFTPLHLSILSEKKYIINRLIKLNANISILNNQGLSARDLALSKGNNYLSAYIDEKTNIINRLFKTNKLLPKLIFTIIFITSQVVSNSIISIANVKLKYLIEGIGIILFLIYFVLIYLDPNYIRKNETSIKVSILISKE